MQPHRQHDAGEFMQFLGQVLSLGRGCGGWQARLATEASATARVTDHGGVFPLILPQTRPDPHREASQTYAPSLQQLIIAWRNQASRHAVVTLPAVLPVQIARFSSEGHKLLFPIRLSEAVYIPYFTDTSVTTASHRYRIAAIIYHLGPARDHGHYRAAFFCKGVLSYVTDDHILPCPVQESDVPVIQENAYLFLLRKNESREAPSSPGDA